MEKGDKLVKIPFLNPVVVKLRRSMVDNLGDFGDQMTSIKYKPILPQANVSGNTHVFEEKVQTHPESDEDNHGH